jgi:hypothetical protein
MLHRNVRLELRNIKICDVNEVMEGLICFSDYNGQNKIVYFPLSMQSNIVFEKD